MAGDRLGTAEVADPLLPAAPYLTGPEAVDVVGAAVGAAGGKLIELSPREVHYRPHRTLVVRYDAVVAWSGGAQVAETIVASTGIDGPPADTLIVEAEVPDTTGIMTEGTTGDPAGSTTDGPPRAMQIGVWRYPFDPELPGLAEAVTPRSAAALLGVAPESVHLVVRSFRACRRAVVEATWDVDGAASGQAFVKVVPPAEIPGLVERHQRFRTAGVPVPEVYSTDVERGLAVLEPLAGRDLRSRLCTPGEPVPEAEDVWRLVERISRVLLDGEAAGTPLLDAAPRHAAMLRAVHRPVRRSLTETLDLLAGGGRNVRLAATVHGDLHDAQIRVDDHGHIVGVLDIDGAGRGDLFDDLGRFVGHLLALAVAVPDHAERIRTYAATCRAEFGSRTDLVELDRRVAAAVVGLATGPFRTQQDGWRDRVEELVETARSLAAGTWWGTRRPARSTSPDEKTLRIHSSGSHEHPSP